MSTVQDPGALCRIHELGTLLGPFFGKTRAQWVFGRVRGLCYLPRGVASGMLRQNARESGHAHD